MYFIQHIKEFEDNKEKIVDFWLSSENTVKVLNSYAIELEYYKNKYAIFIVDHYIEVLKGNKEIADSDIIVDLLLYLEKLNIKSEELFLLCTGLKNALTEFLFYKNLATLEAVKELNKIHEMAISGILRNFTKTVKEISKSYEIIDKYIIVSKTDVTGKILEVSNAFCELSEYSREELLGKSHNIVRHPEMSNEVFKDLWETIKNGKPWHGEMKNKKKNGGYYWVDAIITPIFDNNGNIIFYEAIRQDITSKKEFQSQQHMLIEQSKSAAMGEMISMIAHQWRQPLQAVSILIQKLSLTKMIEQEITDELLDSVVNDIGQQLDYMSKTIDDFRNFFKPDKEKETVLANHAVDKALDFLAYMVKSDAIRINLCIEDKDCYVNIHFNEVVQVLINIMKNARDAMIENKIRNRIINVIVRKEDSSVFIEIGDNAGGIEETIMTKIYEPYFSTKSVKNGTGLGLYMSKTIIEQHCSGNIIVKNQDEGAMFCIVLPLHNRS